MRRTPYALIAAAALLAVLPLLLKGPSCGHDFDFHLLNWLEARVQLTHFTWPRWAYTPAWNAGEPRFIFYPPMSWLLGSMLTLLVPFRFAPIVYTFVCLFLSGLSMYRFALRSASMTAATFAAVVYLANPYMLFTAYERTAYAELLAAAILPLLFEAILAPHPRVLRIAMPVALLWLTNAPAAVMGCYALAVLAVLRLWWPGPAKRSALASNVCAGTLLGFALASFYLFPAALERRFVQIDLAIVPGMDFGSNFLFHHTSDADHDAVLHTASLIACVLLAATLIALAAGLLRARHAPPNADAFANAKLLLILTALIGFLLTPLSAPLWRIAPELAFLQFPWRLLALLTPILAWAIAVAMASLPASTPAKRHSLPPWLAIAGCGLLVLLVTPAPRLFFQHCDAVDTPEGRAAQYASPTGTEPTDEYTPTTADNDALHPGDARFWTGNAMTDDSMTGDLMTDDQASASPANATPGATPDHFEIEEGAPARLILNLRQYPAWRITVNGQSTQPLQPVRDDGLITIAVPAGHSSIAISLEHTADQKVGWTLSLLALLLAAGLWRREQARRPLHFSGEIKSV